MWDRFITVALLVKLPWWPSHKVWVDVVHFDPKDVVAVIGMAYAVILLVVLLHWGDWKL